MEHGPEPETESGGIVETIQVRNNLSGALRTLRVGRYVKESFLVHWELVLPIEIRRNKEGYFHSNPKSFFQKWTLTDESKKALTESILKKREELKQFMAEERMIK